MNLFICVSIAVFLAYPAFSINSGVPWQNQKSAREINEAINNMPHNESKKKMSYLYRKSSNRTVFGDQENPVLI